MRAPVSLPLQELALWCRATKSDTPVRTQSLGITSWAFQSVSTWINPASVPTAPLFCARLACSGAAESQALGFSSRAECDTLFRQVLAPHPRPAVAARWLSARH